ncbi:MAG: DNA mismatch repair MutL family protein, partial [Planctomycetota bacterium]
SNDLIETRSSEKGLQILALLGKPSISRTNNRFQYVFLNGRFIRDKFISHAIKEAYRGLLEPNRFPVVFLFIQMSCEDYDVNVHPTKIEVRFYNANLVHSQILGALREKLLGTDLEMPGRLPPTGPPRSIAPRSASESSQKIADAMAEFFKKHRPVHRQQQIRFRPASGGAARDVSPEKPVQYDNKFMQIHDSFIVAQTDDGFVIIDQHALHECIMYEDLCRRIQTGRLQSQKLLIPESFEVTPSAAEALETNAELIAKMGIELVPFGPRTMAVQAFPTLLSSVQPLDFMQDLIDLLEHTDAGPDAAELLDEVVNMAACKAAIKAGQKLTDGEIEQLLADRQQAESATRCPHGRPTTIRFSITDLEKQFKRT